MDCLNRHVFSAKNVCTAAYFRFIYSAVAGSSRARSADFGISFCYFIKADRRGRWRDMFPDCCDRLHWKAGGALLFPINVPRENSKARKWVLFSSDSVWTYCNRLLYISFRTCGQLVRTSAQGRKRQFVIGNARSRQLFE